MPTTPSHKFYASKSARALTFESGTKTSFLNALHSRSLLPL